MTKPEMIELQGQTRMSFLGIDGSEMTNEYSIV